MSMSIFIFCGLLIVVTTLTAQTQPGTTLSNAELSDALESLEKDHKFLPEGGAF